MSRPESTDWDDQFTREIEPLQRSRQRFEFEIEQEYKSFEVLRGELKQRFREWGQLFRLGEGMVQQIEVAKRNPAHEMAQTRAIQHFWQVYKSFKELQGDLEQLSRRWRPLYQAFVVPRRLRLIGWMVQQLEAAKRNPAHEMAQAWLNLQHLSAKEIAEQISYLIIDMPDLRVPQRRGRQKGRIAASTLKMAEQLEKRIADTGELPTTAAKRLLAADFRGQSAKGRADHLVRVWKRRALKSC